MSNKSTGGILPRPGVPSPSPMSARSPSAAAAAPSSSSPSTHQTGSGNPSPPTTTNAQVDNKPSLLFRIAKRKAQFKAFTRKEKIARLSCRTSCKMGGCVCSGWKSVPAGRLVANPSKTTVDAATVNSSDEVRGLCNTCAHTFEKHVTDLLQLEDDEMDELISTLVDIETIFTILQRDPIVEDPDTKQTFHYLFRLLAKSVSFCSSPLPDFATLGKPPYEDPSISRAMMSLLTLRYRNVNSAEWQGLVDLGKIILNAINTWRLEPPTVVCPKLEPHLVEPYKHMYARWLILCYAPTFCDSLPKYETATIFGRDLLRQMFPTIKKELTDKFLAQQNKLSAKARASYGKLLPGLLENLENAIYSPSCPIWQPNFKPELPAHVTEAMRRFTNQGTKGG